MLIKVSTFIIALFVGYASLAQNNALAVAKTNYKSYLYKEAIPLYIEALQQDPYNSSAMLELAFSYYYTNQPIKAELWFQRVINYESHKKYNFEYGQVLKMNGKYKEAKAAFLSYAKMDYTKGNHFAKSCDFALQKSPMTTAYISHNLAKANSKSADFAPTFYQDKVIFSSSRSVAVEKEGKITWTNDAFNQHYELIEEGENLTSKTLRSYIGNDINDAPVSYLPKKDLVAITSNNFMDGIRHVEGSGLMMDIYTYQIKSEKEWDRDSEVFFKYNANVTNKTPFSTGHPCLESNSTAMYFSSNRPGGYGGYDLYVSYKTSSGWTNPRNLGANINTKGNEMSPFIDKNGDLYFSSDWHHGYGGMDIFQSKKVSYGWTSVQNLGKNINSSADDMYFVFDTKARVGYFSSNRKGGQGNEDIYQAKQLKVVSTYQKLVLNIGDKIILDDSYFNSNDYNLVNRTSPTLYRLVQKLADNPTIAIQINGYTDTKGSASENLSLSKKRATALANYLVSMGISNQRIRHTGYGENFLVNHCKKDVNCSRREHAANRRLEIIAMGTISSNGSLSILKDPTPSPNADVVVSESLKNDAVSSSSKKKRRKSSTKKIVRQSHYAINDLIEVASIYYELNSSKIDEKNSPGLKELLSVLKEHPRVVIEIGAHTDASGSDSYNKSLSAKRASAVKSYLEKKGIASSRLVAKGYGETKLLNHCKNGVKCSKEEQAVNRRTEFTVIAQKGFKVGDIIKVDNINYELNDSKLDMTNSRGLQEIIKLLKTNKISVEIRSHTDSKGSAKYNLELSQKRAKAVYDYLVKKGINKYTLKYKGYGETKLLNKCKDGVRCSKSQHAKNRRTDFKVIGLK